MYLHFYMKNINTIFALHKCLLWRAFFCGIIFVIYFVVRKYTLTISLFCLCFLLSFAQKNGKNIGGIGGQALFDSISKRPIVKSLEINNYFTAHTLKPGDLILEVDKVPVHNMSYSEVLGLVQGVIGTPMSLKILRYNGIEKYYEIKRIRVTLDMNPTWWSVPDYRYFELMDGINYTISQLRVNGRNSIDTTKYRMANDRYFCNFNIRGAYESVYINKGGRLSYSCSFLKSDDRSKAEGMYVWLKSQMTNLKIPFVKLQKNEKVLTDSKDFTFNPKETSDLALANLKINARMFKEFDKEENKDLWKVELDISM